MAKWSPPPSNECPQELICKEKLECQDLCKSREILQGLVRELILDEIILNGWDGEEDDET